MKEIKNYDAVFLFGNDRSRKNFLVKKILESQDSNSNNDDYFPRSRFLILEDISSIADIESAMNFASIAQRVVFFPEANLPKVRAFCDKHSRIGSVPCYSSLHNNESLIRFLLKGVSVELDAFEKLKSIMFFYERDMVISEIEKLLIFLDKRSRVTISDVDKCVTVILSSNIEEMSIAILDGCLNFELLDKNLVLNVIRGMILYFEKLLSIYSIIEIESVTEQKAVESLSNNYSINRSILRHIRKFDFKKIETLLYECVEIEVNCKQHSYISKSLLENFFLNRLFS